MEEQAEREALEKQVEALEKELAEANAAPRSEVEEVPPHGVTPSGAPAVAPVEVAESGEPLPLAAGDDACERRGGVPQVPDIAGLFTQLREQAQPQGDLDGGLVVCRVVTRGNYDAFKGPDLSAKVKIGSFGPKTIRGGEDKWTMYVSAPAVRLRKGQAVSFNVWDRDVFGSDSVGSARKKFAGLFPLYLDHANMDVECRAMGADEASREADDRLEKLERVLAGAPRTLKPRPDEWDWGLGKTAVGEACKQLAEVEGYVGADDPRTDAVEAKIGTVMGQWRGIASRSVAKKVASLDAPQDAVARVEGVELRVASSKGARVTVGVKNTTDKPCAISPFLGQICGIHGVALVAPDGRPVPARIVSPSQDAEIPPGGRAVVTVEGGGDPQASNLPGLHVALLHVARV